MGGHAGIAGSTGAVQGGFGPHGGYSVAAERRPPGVAAAPFPGPTAADGPRPMAVAIGGLRFPPRFRLTWFEREPE